MGTIGDLCEIPGKVKFEWKINDFFQLSSEVNIRYESPKFYFSGASWVIRIFPNGCKKNDTDGWMSVYVARMSSGDSITVDYSFRLKSVTEKIETHTCSRIFNKTKLGFGIDKFISRSTLIERKSELVPSDVLTIICTLKTAEANDIADSLYCRLQDVSDDLLALYVNNNKTDFQSNFSDENNRGHQMIERSQPLFPALSNDDTKENQSDADIDCAPSTGTFRHMYSLDMNNVNTKTAFFLYEIAEKYNIKNHKEVCCEFMMQNLSVDWVCDVIKFAESYQEVELGRRARKYFRLNADKILETENWRIFAEENHDLSIDLLGSLVKVLLRNKKTERKENRLIDIEVCSLEERGQNHHR